MDISAPPVPRTRKRRSAWRCGLVLCSILGVVVFCGVGFLVLKGVQEVLHTMRHPHSKLYSSGGDDVVPLLSHSDKFDVYFAVWARRPDRLQPPIPEDHAYSDTMNRIKTISWMPDEEIIRHADEACIFAERIFTGVSMKDRGLHRDLQFELPLERFYDRRLFVRDLRAVVSIVPHERIKQIANYTDYRPSEAMPGPRMPEEILTTLGLSPVQREVLERLSISFPLLMMRRPHWGEENPEPQDQDPAAREAEIAWMEKHAGPELRKKLDSQWSVRTNWDPVVFTRSHAYLVDQTKPFNRTVFDKKHEALRNQSCGLAEGLPPTWVLCYKKDYLQAGQWETRLEMQDGRVAYGTYMNTPKKMAGPADEMKLPVTRGRPYDPSKDASSITVRHTFTFSTFGAARIGLINNHMDTTDLAHNATAAEIAHAHEAWVQGSGMLGNRIPGARPWRRLIVMFFEEWILGLPGNFLVLLYWYTRLTSSGIHSRATMAIALSSAGEHYSNIFTDKPDTGFLWFITIVFAALEALQSALMISVVLPFEVNRNGWKVDIRRTAQSKRERDTRRAEARTNMRIIGIIFIACASFYTTCKYFDIYIVQPRNVIPSKKTPSNTKELVHGLAYAISKTGIILQLILNAKLGTFAGQYALTTYMQVVQRMLGLLGEFEWFAGKSETRDGVIGLRFADWLLEACAVWQATRYPRVEQIVRGEDEVATADGSIEL